jgi:hypothetical protein
LAVDQNFRRVKLVLFDRGYYSTALIRYLDSAGIKYIMHIPWHGAPLKAGEDRMHVTTTHKRRVCEQAVFRLVTLKQKAKLLVFATNTTLLPRRIGKTFRKRWGLRRVIG